MLQVDKKGSVSVARLSSEQTLSEPVWQQSNVHAEGIRAAKQADGTNYLATCSSSEATLWTLKSADGPAALLDEPSVGAHNSIQSIEIAKTKGKDQSQ